MVIEINKDIDRYQESVAMGLTVKQLIFSVASVVCGGGIVLLLYRYIGLTGSAYIAIPVVAPIALGGFYTYNEMSFYEVMRKKISMMFGNQALSYVSTEGEMVLKVYELAFANTSRVPSMRYKGKQSKTGTVSVNTTIGNQNNKEEFKAVKRKMKVMIICSLAAIILAIVGTFAYKYLGL